MPQPLTKFAHRILVVVPVLVGDPFKGAQLWESRLHKSNSMVAPGSQRSRLRFKRWYCTALHHRASEVCEDSVDAPVLPGRADVRLSDVRKVLERLLNRPLVEIAPYNDERVLIAPLERLDHVFDVAKGCPPTADRIVWWKVTGHCQ